MEQNGTGHFRNMKSPDNRKAAGVILLAAGGLLLANKLGAPVPKWIFTWPMILITVGLLTGVKSNFRNPGAFIMILVGGVFLLDESMPGLNFHNYIFPVLLMGIGLIYILRPKKKRFDTLKQPWDRTFTNLPAPVHIVEPEPARPADNTNTLDTSEYIEINAVFGGVKKIILSKDFRGGEVNSFMGGTELNLMQADIRQPVTLEVNNIFGGTKLILPSNWDVKNEVTAVFGGIDDKRSFNTVMPDAGKTIILKGTCVFGGIEVNNY